MKTEQEISYLKAEVERLKNIINVFLRSDRYRFNKDLEFGQRVRFICPVGDVEGEGLQIATSPTQKVGFFGAFPVGQQPYVSSDPSFRTISGSGADTDINYNFQRIISQQDDLIAGFISLGLMAEP